MGIRTSRAGRTIEIEELLSEDVVEKIAKNIMKARTEGFYPGHFLMSMIKYYIRSTITPSASRTAK